MREIEIEKERGRERERKQACRKGHLRQKFMISTTSTNLALLISCTDFTTPKLLETVT